MTSRIEISLNLSASSQKIADRIQEVQSAIPYKKVVENPEIKIITAIANDKEEIENILKATELASLNYDYLTCLVSGWEKSQNNKKFSLSFGVEPAENLEIWYEKLTNEISSIKIKPRNNTFEIPVTDDITNIEMQKIKEAIGEKCGIISRFLQKTFYKNTPSPKHSFRALYLPVDIMRITIKKDGKLYREFDLPSKKWITLQSKNTWKKTLENYRLIKNYEINASQFDDEKEIFLISDLHLGHSEIIKNTARPFENTKEMNKILIENWNNTVKPEDTVIFAGDLSYNSSYSEVHEYLAKLNGNIIFVKGNHDHCLENGLDSYTFSYKDFNFFVVHDPKKIPENNNSWAIHGHTHNSRLYEYPFIEKNRKTINVSCELTGYKPINIRDICNLIKNTNTEKIISGDLC
ncbi:hypothetical protein F1737_05015 [Methanoplanus sp. FWC-SCC4]|uniref:Calcineurin-like phosphoesterase domain-containing protein n=1 Tax=Methanochimaera problematica TaxID=2609417 RepID=A0AA97I2C2_9EURY|nr:metallophosphoesterase [Methanoplanus sp. FWC-SCC4]WOF16110.1 hypothetical protein F1737_05015 [Methanoplanus sp. FWC-SCC4]